MHPTNRPTISLAMICKDELHNIPRLFASVKDCFDEVHITDTGSTDGTMEHILDLIESGKDIDLLGCRIYLHHFEWIKDFAAARNYSFSFVKTDYVAWLDFDDSLLNKDMFIKWRDTAMGLADYWLNQYNYALHSNGSAAITFTRERVFKVSKNPKWNYLVHEGVVPSKGSTCQFISTWSVNHHRTTDDMLADKGRNLDIFNHWIAKDPKRIDHRMKYYYGKELFEADKPMEAFTQLIDACGDPKLENHDRILGLQYAALAAMKCNQLEKAIQVAHQGLQLDPNRSEYYVIIADSYVKLGKLRESIPFYEAARSGTCSDNKAPSAIFQHQEAYGVYPTNQLARVNYHVGNFERARIEAKKACDAWDEAESKGILSEIEKAISSTLVSESAIQTEDIVITTPPQGAYEWDEIKYKEKAMGGSETAAIEMSMWLRKLTGRPVKIFNMRDSKLVGPSGVEYISIREVNEYFSKYKPFVHIAWRHNIKLTTAPTYLWCHDLVTPGSEVTENYEKQLCLTPFHARYVHSMQGVPMDKIHITRNGLRPERFYCQKEKIPGKIVFPSSPDRGLKEAMIVLDEVIKTHPVELHVFYGIEHLHKYGLKAMADELKVMMDARPWVKYHGATQQDVLINHFKEACIWLHPASFIESSCITAMEMLACGTYPVTRRLGGLADTLMDAEAKGMATVLDCDPAESLQPYIDATIKALDDKAWEKVQVDVDSLSWENVAREWVNDFNLGTDNRFEIQPKEANL